MLLDGDKLLLFSQAGEIGKPFRRGLALGLQPFRCIAVLSINMGSNLDGILRRNVKSHEPITSSPSENMMTFVLSTSQKSN